MRFIFRGEERILGERFRGWLVTDFYAAYNLIPGRHQRCWVHLLRDLHALKEAQAETPEVVQWAQAVRKLYEDARAWLDAQATPPDKARHKQYTKLYQRACALGQQYALGVFKTSYELGERSRPLSDPCLHQGRRHR